MLNDDISNSDINYISFFWAKWWLTCRQRRQRKSTDNNRNKGIESPKEIQNPKSEKHITDNKNQQAIRTKQTWPIRGAKRAVKTYRWTADNGVTQETQYTGDDWLIGRGREAENATKLTKTGEGTRVKVGYALFGHPQRKITIVRETCPHLWSWL